MNHVTIDTALKQFLSEQERKHTRAVFLSMTDVLANFRLFLEREGQSYAVQDLAASLSAPVRFARSRPASRILKTAVGFFEDLAFQKAIHSPGFLSNAEHTFHNLARWLMQQRLCTESDYLELLPLFPHSGQHWDAAEQLSSMLYDWAADHPPIGKILEEVRGYVEIQRIQRGVLVLLPIDRTDLLPSLHVSQAMSVIAQVHWWLDLHLMQTPTGWYVANVGNVLP